MTHPAYHLLMPDVNSSESHRIFRELLQKGF